MIKYQTLRKNERGFTLLEVLVVITVFATVGVIVAGILTSSLRGSNKTNTIIDVKEEGNRALFYMSQAIRYAKKFNGVIDSNSTTNPPTVITDCSDSSSTKYDGVKITSFDDQETTFMCCNNSTPPTIASLSATTSCSNSVSLLDTSQVSLDSSCYFTCNQLGPSDFPAIGINFSLTASSLSSFSEKTASASAIPFQTSVVMRNLYK